MCRSGSAASGSAGIRDPMDQGGGSVPVLVGGCAIALVSFADTSVLSRAYAARTAPQVDPNQEMVGLGAANLAAGLFQGFPISSSSSRTPVAEAAGARTQLTGVVGAVAVALLLLLAPNLLQNLPAAALAAVVIASADGLDRDSRLVRIYSHPAVGVLAVDRLFRRRRGFRRHPRHRSCDRHRDHRVPVGRLAAAFCGPGPRRRRQGLPRHHALSRRPPDPRSGAFPLGRAVVFRQCRVVQGASSGHARGKIASSVALAGGRGGAESPTWTSPRPTRSPNWTIRFGRRASNCASPSSKIR